MSAQFRYTLVWLGAAVVVVVITLQMTDASFIDGQYLPVGHDAFYHARRILDAVASGHLFQFDPLMHVPEGDWVTWPWAYDLALAKMVRLVMLVSGADNPVTVLMHLPPLLAVVAVAIVVAICAELRLPVALACVVSLCFALHAFTQYQFGVGALDHHGTEQIATLGALWLGLRWLHQPSNSARACVAGIWFGAVMGVHAGLFFLQIPLLGALLLGWVRGTPLPRPASTWFVAGLMFATLLVLVPSATFWSTRFVVYYLSWLHLYISACSGVVVLFVSRRTCSKASILKLAAISGALAVPLLAAVAFSKGFLSGNLSTISDIDEIYSPYAIAGQENGLRRVNQLYTLLIWIAPLTMAACIGMALREKDTARSYFWVACAFGLVLTLLQLRLGSFGVYYLYLPLLVMAYAATTRWPRARSTITAAVACLLVAAYWPTVRYQLFGGHVPAMDQQYATLRPLIPVLRDACAADPGVVLAEPGDGHLIRYFTQCSVISNNFRLTPMDVAKVKESLDLIAMPLDKVRARAPQVKYVVARLVAPNESPNPVLFRQLLSSNLPRPMGIDALAELKVTHPDGSAEKFLGAYKIRP